MLQPARRKYRKEQKGRNKGVATVGNKVSFGEYGLKAIGRGRLTARQIEAARRAMTRHIKRGGRVWIRIFPDKPMSKKPAEVRMGNGKGNPGVLRRGDRARQGALRDGRRRRDHRARGVRARRREAADPDDVRPPARRRLTEVTMKRTDNTKALAAKSPAELKTELAALLKEQFGLRMQRATQQLTNTEKLKQVRRNIARARTLIHQKAEAGMSEQTQTADGRAGAAEDDHPDADRPGRRRQDEQDGHGAGRAARQASALRQVRDQVEQVPRARREQRVQGRATWSRSSPAASSPRPRRTG